MSAWTNEDEATLLYLRDVEQLGWEEICRRMERTMGSVRGKYQRLKYGRYGPSVEVQDGTETFESTGPNTATVSSNRSKRIMSLEDLLEACKVDLSVWRVDRYLVNKWEVGAKAEFKDLTWTHGVMDGTVQAEGLTISPLFQVKAWLSRIEPVTLFPTIQAVACERDFDLSSIRVRTEGIGRTLVLADPQFGFKSGADGLIPLHDWRALDIALQLAELCQPDRVDILGDMFDFASWTDRFLRAPEYTGHTQAAINDGHRFLCLLREVVPHAKISLFEGNHDKRMRDAIITHLRAAYGLRAADELELPPALSVERLLSLHKLGIAWIGEYPQGEDWLNDGVRLSHGDVARIWGETAKAVVREADVTEVFGHVHRLEWTSRALHLRHGIRIIVGFAVPCLCHIDGRVPSKRARQQWQNGCAIVDYEVKGRGFSIAPILIENGRAFWNGTIIEARDESCHQQQNKSSSVQTGG